jgi:putative transposase
MRRFAGSCRFVFNRALALQKELFELSGAHASYADLCAVLVDWKQDKETDWLNEAPSQALQQSLKNLDAAWARRLDSLKKLKQGRINRAQLRQHQAALRKAQQSISRKKKFSQNWKRAKARLACLHIRIASARRDYLHKASTAISKNHASLCVSRSSGKQHVELGGWQQAESGQQGAGQVRPESIYPRPGLG